MDSSNRETTPRVVVGVDGSDASREALRWAARHAELTGAVVEAVCAWDTPSEIGWAGPATEAGFDLERARLRYAEGLREVFGDSEPTEVRQMMVQGDPSEVLVRASEGAELLVVGNRGRGGFARAMLGSVSQRCAQHAKCPVVVVRATTTGGH
ncbi:universal stress protein [Streptomyces sp. NPDC020403]|uniref:universal stress protein n=1 Tax=unclassified Streptomyces TaxID=2593676 RepID=UPI0033D26454